MTVKLREAMAALAEASPTVKVAPGLFDKARRRRRAQVAGGAVAVVAVLAGVVSLAVAAVKDGEALEPATGQPDRHPPSTVARAPKWVADLRDAPLAGVQLAYVEPGRDGKDGRSIVMSGDSYRQVDPGGVPSPDGRYLAYGERETTKLIDVSTGGVAMRAEGELMAWSRRGDFAVLRRSHGPQGQMEMSVVGVPSGAIAWSFEVVPPCAGHHLSLSPDNEWIALGCQQYGTYLYRHAVGLVWHMKGRDIAGPQAWAPDGRTIATWARYEDVYYHELFMLDIADGRPVGTIPTRDFGKAEVVAWYGGLPVLQGPDWVQPLARDQNFLIVAEHSKQLLLATEAIDFGGSRKQGGIDAGPVLARYRELVPAASVALSVVLVLAGVLIVRRLRRERWLR